MRRWGSLLLAAVLLAAGMPGKPARAEAPEMRISVSGDQVLPGEAVTVSFTVPEDGECDILLVSGKGETLPLAEDRPARAGYNAFYWNGTSRGWAVPEGEWTVRLEMNGRSMRG